MPEINYSYLRKLQQEEKDSMLLTEVEQEFYNKLEKYIKTKKQELKNNPSLDKIKEFENTVRILRNLYQIRQQKILLRTIQSSGEDKEGMTKEEIETYHNIKQLIEKNKIRFEEILEEKSKKNNLKKIKIVKTVPTYTGIDGNIYGPFEPEQEKELPEKEAEFLIKAEMARLGE